jgi:membrane-associated phospholipid phosphatase
MSLGGRAVHQPLTAVAIPLSMFYPIAAPVLLTLAASIAVSRIILGMHFLSDVIAGSALGSLLGCIAFYVIYRISPIRPTCLDTLRLLSRETRHLLACIRAGSGCNGNQDVQWLVV